jgi:hypothetical protein
MFEKLLNKIVEWGERSGRTRTILDYLDGSPYLTRVRGPRLFGVRPMLHHFHRPDGDRALHNHPWRWAISIVLSGSYLEERRGGLLRVVSRFNLLRAEDFHRVAELRGDVWTIFVAGPECQQWGFDEDGEFTYWREYIDRERARRKAEQERAATERDLARRTHRGRAMLTVVTPFEGPDYVPDVEETAAFAELVSLQERCQHHRQPGYSDPEADGCPECGWGAK